MTDVLNRLTNVKEFETKPLLGYVVQFKQNRDFLKIHGKVLLKYFV